MNSNNNANKVDLPLKNDLPQENNNAEEVNLKTTKITATDKIFFESNNDVGQQQSFWRRNKRICICSIILFALCVCITRVPFVGSYLDAFVFDYLWGCAKYIIYLWGIILCVVTMFNPHFTRSLFKPKMIVIQIFCIFACSLIFSAVTHWANPDLTNVQVDEGYFKTVMENYHSNHFLEYIQGSSQYHYAYSSTSTWWMDIYYKVNDKFYTFVGGGLIGELCVGLGYLFIILFAVSLVAFCVISIISARSPAAALAIQKFFSKLFGNKRIKGKQNELEVEKNDIKVAEVSSEEIKKEIATNSDETPPIRFLTDTSVDNYAINKDRAEKVKYGISAFCKQHAITPKQFNVSIMPLYTEVSFKVGSQEDINIILKNEVELSSLTKLKEFNILFKGNVVKLEYANKLASKVSLKSVLSTNKIDKNQGTLLLGICQDNIPLFYNLYKQPSMLIAGTKGSGATMLLSNILLTFAYLNKPEENKFTILAKNENAILSNFKTLPHIESINKVNFTANNVRDILKDFSDHVDRRLEVYKTLEIENFDKYNAYCIKIGQPIEHRRTLVFCDYDEVVINNYEYTSLIKNILENGHKCGIHLIIHSNKLNHEILQETVFNYINSKMILRVSSENESLLLFDNYRAFQLYGNGDGYIFGKSPDEKVRFQTCYLNQNELAQTIDIIINFYKK